MEKSLYAPGTIDATAHSSKLIVSLFYTYFKQGTNAVISEHAMNAMIQGLRNMYSENRHRGCCNVERNTKI